MSEQEWNAAQLRREVDRLNRENAELDQALAESMAATEKAQAQAVRWMQEARYWYARAGKLATGKSMMPVVLGGVPDEEPVPVVTL